MISDALLAVGLVFSSLTLLRLPGLDAGPGELCLLVWLITSFGCSVSRLNISLPRQFFALAKFWTVFLAALCIGAMTAIVIGERNSNDNAVHDIGAFAMVAALSVLAIVQKDAEARLRRTAWFTVILGSGCLAAQLAQAFDVFEVSGVDVWY